MIKIGLAVCLSILVFSCERNSRTEKLKHINSSEAELEVHQLDSWLRHTMDSLEIPGLSLAIINDASIVYHRAIGMANVETKDKVNANSIFEAASLSKPVFAYFVLKMAEKGVINLDHPLHFYLDDTTMHVDSRFKSINARMVLAHTTGFPNWRWFEPAPPEMNLAHGSFYMKADPGTFTYSGEGYQYLARVLAHNNFVNMHELANLFESEVSGPLKMEHAYFVWDDFLYHHKVFGHKNNQLDTRAWGTALPHQHSKILNAAGGLHTESRSYANFLIALMNEEGLYKSTFEEMLAVQSNIPKDHRYYKNQQTIGWGLGIAIEEHQGVTLHKHGGNNGGFTSGFMLSKNHMNGYVFFINCDKGSQFDAALRNLLLI